MNMLNRLRKEHPEFIGERFPGGVAICPEDVGYPATKDCPVVRSGYKPEPDVCLRCWDREAAHEGD